MSAFDSERRSALKGIGAAAVLAASAGVLNAAESMPAADGTMLVLTGESPDAAAFAEGIRRGRDAGAVRRETVSPVSDFAGLEALLDRHLSEGVSAVAGLVDAAAYPLLTEALQRRDFRFCAEIVHRADAGGSLHAVTVPHTAAATARYAGRLLPQSGAWAFAGGAALGRGSVREASGAGVNRFQTVRVVRPERGTGEQIAFLVTLKKEQKHV